MSNTLFCFQVTFYYFGARHIHDTVFVSADVDDASSSYCINDEIFYSQLSQFRTAISEDIACLNGAEVGTKVVDNFVEWETNGNFQRIKPSILFIYTVPMQIVQV